ncbi:MAG: hypothetical protein ABJF50_00475 [Paracoccaceae bacterium]
MATVVFIHGISNMPKPSTLLSLWENSFATDTTESAGLEVANYGASSELVYWSDVLYPDYAKTRSGAESANTSLEMSNAIRGDTASLEEVSEEWVRRISEALEVDSDDLRSSTAPSESDVDGASISAAAAEAIPLPWILKKPLMRTFVRDAHHYLFNVKHSPRKGTGYHVRDEIRNRFLAKLEDASKGGPVIVVAHSLGTVIAYDCLKNVPECPKIQSLITVGSPLGMTEMQDKLDPGYSRDDGFAREKIASAWYNVYDPVDVVSRADPKLSNDYLEHGKRRIEDIRQSNGGAWTHGMLKYSKQAGLRETIRAELMKL